MGHDLRKYARDTNARLIVGALFFLFILGIGLIWLIYGAGAALMGFLCLLGAFVPIGLIFLALYLLDWITKRAGGD
jgi:hypothetical protein